MLGRQKPGIATWLFRPFVLPFLLVAFLQPGQAEAEGGPLQLYTQHCASCHGADRLGLMGPALLPENLARLKRSEAVAVIQNSRPAVQMPAFRDILKPDEIQQLVDWIMTPVSPSPKWGDTEIRASRIVHFAPGSLPDKPVFSADPLNLFVVVEGATIMSPSSMATSWSRFTGSLPGLPCMADRSSRRTGAMCSSRHVTAGSPSSISGT